MKQLYIIPISYYEEIYALVIERERKKKKVRTHFLFHLLTGYYFNTTHLNEVSQKRDLFE